MDNNIALSPEDLATLLLEEMVDTQHVLPLHLEVDENTSARFMSHVRQYQLAAVMMALMQAEQKDSRFIAARTEFESLIFPRDISPDAMNLILLMRAAMGDLDRLIHPEKDRTQLNWARTWLASASIEESNPATLYLHAIQWMDFYISQCEFLGRVELLN